MLRAVSFDTGRVRRGEPEDIYRAVADAQATGDSYKLSVLSPSLLKSAQNPGTRSHFFLPSSPTKSSLWRID